MNRSCAGRKPSDADLVAIRAADAVILPRGCRKNLYSMARRNCANIFPNYDACYSYPGKTGQFRLFRKNSLMCPETRIFNDTRAFWDSHTAPPFPFPCVFKFAWGGEGKYVYLLNNHEDFQKCMTLAEYWREKGMRGFLFQEYIPSGGRSLRSVVMGRHIYTYWRVQKNTEQFYTNIAKGAVIDRHSSPGLQDLARRATEEFCSKTGLNLAGLDFLFSTEEKQPEPLFLEVNYFFHYTGLGGTEAYCQKLSTAVNDWLDHIGPVHDENH